MREIKFRQWNFESKKFRYVGAIDDGVWAGVSSLDFDKSPLMQFTGLHDKNGKEIYEGDILTAPFGDCSTKHKVYFENGCFKLAWKSLDEWNKDDLEIIGNICETGLK